MNKKMAAVSLVLLLICGALSCKFVMPERYVDYNKGRVPVNLPRDLKNSDKDINMERAEAVIITVAADGRLYLGADHSPIEGRVLAAKIKPMLESQPPEDRIAYLAVDVSADYGHVVTACDAIRKIDLAYVGLMVNRIRDDTPSRLLVELPAEPNPNEDLSHLKPNPLTLVVEIRPDLTLRLNQDAIGSVNDLSSLSEKLQQIFRMRLEQHAYREGYETRVDVPESERIEKTVAIKAPTGVKYGDVVKLIDAIKGAGSSPIVFQLDDLPRLTPIARLRAQSFR
jgi:biopolymer transport protein ExbD